MKNGLYEKGLVIGIIVLFIAMSITPSSGKIDAATSRTTIYDGSLSGYVNDTSGNPIEGALVRVYFHETYEEDYSDSTGYYHVTNIPICYCLKNATCSKEGYKTEWVLLGITENTTHDFILMPNQPPEITDVMLITSDPLDTDPSFGWENFTCNVTDNDGVDEVKLKVTYTSIFTNYTIEYPMTNIPGTDVYYYYTTFIYSGHYSYFIWANDTNGNTNESLLETFHLPPNYDIDMNGRVHFLDLVTISVVYNQEGPNGWIRQDINNDGKVHFGDFIPISLHYNEEW